MGEPKRQEPGEAGRSDAPDSRDTASVNEHRAVWRSDQLFGPLQEIGIRHGDSVYRLRKTALGKLILTK